MGRAPVRRCMARRFFFAASAIALLRFRSCDPFHWHRPSRHCTVLGHAAPDRVGARPILQQAYTKRHHQGFISETLSPRPRRGSIQDSSVQLTVYFGQQRPLQVWFARWISAINQWLKDLLFERPSVSEPVYPVTRAAARRRTGGYSGCQIIQRTIPIPQRLIR